MSGETVSLADIRSVTEVAWEKLSGKKIYFGHQSVGFNIFDGIKDVMKEFPQIKLNIRETKDAADFSIALLAHSRIGRNTDPESKTIDFVRFMNEGIGNQADIAFFKFCYVDVDAKTNVQKVFQNYRSSLSELRNKYPDTTFIHVTVPLKTIITTWKTWMKKLMGEKEIWEYEDNIRRNEYNELLRKEFDGNEPVFDLALIESAFPNGKRASFTKDGKRYFSMVPDYTKDGGHLNEKGRRKVAEQLLIFLANLPS